MDREAGLPGEEIADQNAGQIGGGQPQRQAGGDPDQREEQDLYPIYARDQAARGAQAFERRDGRGPALQIAAHRVADADPADQQRGQPDEGQEHAQAVDETGQARRRLAGVAHAPTGGRECLRQLSPQDRGIASGIAGLRQAQPVVMVV